jgi:hypothetical protein
MDESGIEHFITLPSLGAGTVVVFVVILILTGRLIPRYLYQMLTKDRDQWREIALALTKQNQELMVSARISSKLLDTALPPSTEGRDNDG